MTEETTASSAPEPSEASVTGGKRYSAEVWAEIEAHFECGTMTVTEISEQYGPSTKAIVKHCERNGVIRNSKKHLLKKAKEEKLLGAAAVAEEPLAVLFEQKRPARIAETEEHIFLASRNIRGRVFKILKDIGAGVRKESECAGDIKVLLAAEKLITLNRANSMGILKADQNIANEKMPTLVFRDLSDEEVQAKISADVDSEFDLDIPTIPSSITEDDDDRVIEEGEPSPSI